ncbi:putative holin-like toxin [Sporolactobacillus mangiferae]
MIAQGWSAHSPSWREVLPMTVADALMLMISFGALIVAIMSDRNPKK